MCQLALESSLHHLDGFDPTKHITTKNLSQDQDHNGLKVTVLHLPTTNAMQVEGEDVFWAWQDGATDPDVAMANHLTVNSPYLTTTNGHDYDASTHDCHHKNTKTRKKA